MTNQPHVVIATTRRSWSRAEKAAILAETLEPSATVSTVARRHGIHSSLLFRWRRVAQGGVSVSSAMTPSFIPLALPAPPVEPPSRAGVISIELAGGHRVRVEGACDPALLRDVLAALAGR